VRRAVAVGAVVLAAAAALVVVARWERSHWIDQQNETIASIRAAVGPLDGPTLAGYRETPQFRCLSWRRGPRPYALELCFDPSGRVIEALDRRAEPKLVYGSLRSEPAAATTRLDPRLASRLLARLEAPAGS